MRIITGRLGGRTFDAPKNSRTHPMSDKLRGALFNALGDIEGLTIVDAFAGSGALGLEALSRGAAAVTFIEHDNAAQKTIDKNISAFGLERQTKVVKTNIATWLNSNLDVLFDVVLADPPYDDLHPELLSKVADRAKPGAVIIFSLPPKVTVELPTKNYELLTMKPHGDAQLVFYRRIS